MRDFQSTPDYWSKAFGDFPLVKALGALVAAGAAALFPNEVARTGAAAVLILVGLDTATGMVAARVSGEAISSGKLRRAVVKLFGYFSAILAVALGFRATAGLGALSESAVSSVTSLMALTELLSIFENLKRMGFPLPSWIVRALTERSEAIQRNPTAD